MLRMQRPVFVVSPPWSGAALLFEVLSHSTAFSPIRDAAELLAGIGGHRLDGSAVTPEIARAVRRALSPVSTTAAEADRAFAAVALRVAFFARSSRTRSSSASCASPGGDGEHARRIAQRRVVTEAALPRGRWRGSTRPRRRSSLDDLARSSDDRVHYVRYERLVDSWPAELLRSPRSSASLPSSAHPLRRRRKSRPRRRDCAACASPPPTRRSGSTRLAVSRSRATRGLSRASTTAGNGPPNAFVSVVSARSAEILHESAHRSR